MVPQILGFIIFTDIHHATEVLNQRPVRIIRCSLIKKSPPVRIGIQHNLQGVDHCRLPAAGMAGEKIDPLIQSQYLPVYIMPVIQAYL